MFIIDIIVYGIIWLLSPHDPNKTYSSSPEDEPGTFIYMDDHKEIHNFWTKNEENNGNDNDFNS